MVSSICKRLNENDQHHFRNEKILDQNIGDFDIKLEEMTKKKEEETEEPLRNRKETVNSNYKCDECSLTFGNKGTLKKHFQVNHP